MHKLLAKLTVWAKDKEGATAIEYGLIAAGISIAIAGIVLLVGDDLVAVFNRIREGLNTTAGGGA